MRRILIARLHSFGDVVLTTGVAMRLAEKGEAVEVLTAERFAPLFEGLGLQHLWIPTEIGRAGAFDSVVDLQANGTSRRMLRGLGKAGYNRGRGFARRFLVFR